MQTGIISWHYNRLVHTKLLVSRTPESLQGIKGQLWYMVHIFNAVFFFICIFWLAISSVIRWFQGHRLSGNVSIYWQYRSISKKVVVEKIWETALNTTLEIPNIRILFFFYHFSRSTGQKFFQIQQIKRTQTGVYLGSLSISLLCSKNLLLNNRFVISK